MVKPHLTRYAGFWWCNTRRLRGIDAAASRSSSWGCNPQEAQRAWESRRPRWHLPLCIGMGLLAAAWVNL